MVTLRDYSFRYKSADRFAVEGVSAGIHRGEVLAVVGPSEAGKTTLAYAVAGLLNRHFPGSTQFGSIDHSAAPDADAGARIGFVFQDSAIQLSGITETVEEEIGFALEQFGFPPPLIRERIEEQLSMFGMHRLRNRHPQSLSGGETQLLAIAAEAAKHPPLFILDEPTQALDARNIRALSKAIRTWKTSSAVLITEERMNLSLDAGDSFLFLENGSPTFLGPLEGLLNSKLNLSSLDIPAWAGAQILLERPVVSSSLRHSVRWLKDYRISK